jgi:prepilin-type N-terminal cleavage/methylation domain-containing protein
MATTPTRLNRALSLYALGSGRRGRGLEFRVQGSGFRVQDYSLPAANCSLPTRLSFRRGFTLIEVLLTLAVLVITSALAWPQLDKIFNTQRLRKAADIVRIQWCKGRIAAMKTGSIHVFRFQVDGNSFRLEPYMIDPTNPQSTAIENPLSDDSIQLIL